ncbi:28S ribosomal protein S29, mitochondrial [Intoshia linei]|uniref:Small ribosomal subunit protein mS29 n=1 Tax=Intoshia linei TaxID=1819745 RepID=A0A177AUC5_9BILA|nr:28S ribosomal protein S29, mitochondrial [Intoshia linei]
MSSMNIYRNFLLNVRKDANFKYIKQFTTASNNPNDHTYQDVGKFYEIDKNDMTRWFPQGFSKYQHNLWNALGKSHVMIRKSAVEMLTNIKSKIDFDQAPIKYILYGSYGNGKTSTLCHVMHYCYTQNWMVLHDIYGHSLNRKRKYPDLIINEDGSYSVPSFESQWLATFHLANYHLLDKFDLRLKEDVVWGTRDSSKAGNTWKSTIEMIVGKPKFASQGMKLLFRDIKEWVNQKKFKLLLAIDGVNSYGQPTNIKTGHQRKDDRSTFSDSLEMVYFQCFDSFLSTDWTNGIILTTVDSIADCRKCRHDRSLTTPVEILDKKMFYRFEPHIPIKVDDYSPYEFQNCLQYYHDVKYLQNNEALTEEGMNEIKFLSTNNPRDIYRVLFSW